MMSIRLRTGERIDLIVFDFDGVLTDNRVLVFADGNEAVFCNRSDGLGFDAFRAAGVPAVILSTERNAVVAARAAKLQVPALHGISDKSAVLIEYCQTNSIELGQVMFVGNDVNDLKLMRQVGWPAAVADAHPAVLRCARVVLQRRGGEGAAREIAEDIFGLDIAGGEPWKS